MRGTRAVAVAALMLTLALVQAVAAATPDSMSPWSLQLNPQGRFQVLQDFHGQAVLDKETGLVWEQEPATAPFTWIDARGGPSVSGCANKNIGGRKGWRLPSIAELASLLDPNAAGPPLLPAGHPFTHIQATRYWSATLDVFPPQSQNAWHVNFVTGEVVSTFIGFQIAVWCVRGPMQESLY